MMIIALFLKQMFCCIRSPEQAVGSVSENAVRYIFNAVLDLLGYGPLVSELIYIYIHIDIGKLRAVSPFSLFHCVITSHPAFKVPEFFCGPAMVTLTAKTISPSAPLGALHHSHKFVPGETVSLPFPGPSVPVLLVFYKEMEFVLQKHNLGEAVVIAMHTLDGHKQQFQSLRQELPFSYPSIKDGNPDGGDGVLLHVLLDEIKIVLLFLVCHFDFV